MLKHSEAERQAFILEVRPSKLDDLHSRSWSIKPLVAGSWRTLQAIEEHVSMIRRKSMTMQANGQHRVNTPWANSGWEGNLACHSLLIMQAEATVSG